MFYSVQSDRPTYRSVSEVHDARARREASVARGSRHGATQVRRTTRSVFLSPGGCLLDHGLLTGTTLRRASMVTPRYPGQFTWSSLGSPLRTLEANARGSEDFPEIRSATPGSPERVFRHRWSHNGSRLVLSLACRTGRTVPG